MSGNLSRLKLQLVYLQFLLMNYFDYCYLFAEKLSHCWSCLILRFCCIRHYSHVTKNRIFKNLNLRKKADRSLCGNFLNNHFRQLKLYQIPQLIGQKSLSYGHILNGKRLKFTMLRESTFQVLVRGSSPPKKT